MMTIYRGIGRVGEGGGGAASLLPPGEGEKRVISHRQRREPEAGKVA